MNDEIQNLANPAAHASAYVAKVMTSFQKNWILHLYEHRHEVIDGLMNTPKDVIPIIKARLEAKQDHFLTKRDSLNREW